MCEKQFYILCEAINRKEVGITSWFIYDEYLIDLGHQLVTRGIVLSRFGEGNPFSSSSVSYIQQCVQNAGFLRISCIFIYKHKLDDGICREYRVLCEIL